MAEECVYTSATRGLRPGSSGFCTVAHTRNMRPSTLKVLESLSAYRTIFVATDQRAALNPVTYSHYRKNFNGQSVSILSRIAPAGRDHTNRDNKLAHHLILNPWEKSEGGPAWITTHDELWITEWEDDPQLFEHPRTMPRGDYEAPSVNKWQQLQHDPGWAGLVAYECVSKPRDCVYIVYEPGTDILGLVNDVFSLVPAPRRWLITFNTHFQTLPPGMTCKLRCCTPDAQAIKSVRGRGYTRVLDLTTDMGEAPENPYVAEARNLVEA